MPPFENLEEALGSEEAKSIMQGMIDKEKEGWKAESEKDTAGLKAKNQEILDKLKTEKEANAQWDGLDNKAVKSLMDKMAGDKELQLMAEGKFDEAMAVRLSPMKKDHEAKINARDTKISEQASTIEARDEEITSLVIDGMVRDAYTGLNYEPSAMADMIRNGREVFKRDEEGQVVPRDVRGNVLFGKDGTTPVTAAEWLESEAEVKKFLKPASSGSGANHSRRSGSTGFDGSTATSTQKIAHGLEKLGIGQ